MKKGIWLKILPTGALLLSAILIILGIFLYRGSFTESGLLKKDLESFSSAVAEAEGVFLSGVAVGEKDCPVGEVFRESAEEFRTYCAIDVKAWKAVVKNPDQMRELLDATLGEDGERTAQTGNSANGIAERCRIVYLVLPVGSLADQQAYVDLLRSEAASHPGVKFRCLFDAESLETWSEKSEDTRTESLGGLRSATESLAVLENVRVFFPGAERWLIANPENYCGNGNLIPDMFRNLNRRTFMAETFEVTEKNIEAYLELLTGLVEENIQSPATYPKMQDVDIVLFGDSIIGNYTDTTSIPSVITGLSGARCFNLAVGGMTGAEGFLNAVEEFLKNGDSYDLREKLCFVVEFGINDYIGGYLVEDASDPLKKGTYAGSLRTGIRKLKEAYPDAVFLVMTPNKIGLFSFGTEVRSAQGDVLSVYAQAARDVAEGEQALCLDCFAELGIEPGNTELFLEDEVHLNENTRMIVGEKIIYALAPQVQ